MIPKKIEAALNAQVPNVTIRRYQKPSLAPVNDEQLAAIRDECDAAVAGWGH